MNWEQVQILGANNRDLQNFEVDLHRGIELLHRSNKDTVRVSESGLGEPEDLMTLWEHDIDSALIGEFFMRQPDPGAAVRDLRAGFQRLKEESKRVQEG